MLRVGAAGISSGQGVIMDKKIGDLLRKLQNGVDIKGELTAKLDGTNGNKELTNLQGRLAAMISNPNVPPTLKARAQKLMDAIDETLPKKKSNGLLKSIPLIGGVVAGGGAAAEAVTLGSIGAAIVSPPVLIAGALVLGGIGYSERGEIKAGWQAIAGRFQSPPPAPELVFNGQIPQELLFNQGSTLIDVKEGALAGANFVEHRYTGSRVLQISYKDGSDGKENIVYRTISEQSNGDGTVMTVHNFTFDKNTGKIEGEFGKLNKATRDWVRSGETMTAPTIRE